MTREPVRLKPFEPGINRRRNIKFKATALPRTSARSHAPIAISLSSQLGQRVHWGYQSRQHCARSFPVTTPSRAAITCMKMAIRLAKATTHRSRLIEKSGAQEKEVP